MSLWIDPAIDGYHNLLIGQRIHRLARDWRECINQFDENEILFNSRFLNPPDSEKVRTFVTSALDKCLKYKPEWITVPQLPMVNDSSRNKINRALAKATCEWRSKSQFKGKLILPLIFTHQNQLRLKVQWKAKLKLAKACYDNAEADGIWVVDSDLYDQKGSGTFGRRFSQLIEFHKNLKETFPKNTTRIAGPYWGMNLVLWARELCDRPAISLGTAYRYYISGSFIRPGKFRVAISPLRRWAVADYQLREWLETALKQFSSSDPASRELSYLVDRYDILTSQSDAARDQVARFYKEWFDKIEASPPAGRALALYQDLSSAYVIGKQRQLPELPKSEAPGRAPERVAQQFMLNCL